MYPLWFLSLFLLLQIAVGPPVDPKKKESKKDSDVKENEIDDLGLEYGRYLQQIVQTLEEDTEFSKKLENISAEQIRSGQIAHELEFVKLDIRTKLDELKRMELDRLHKLLQKQVDRVELGLYRDEDGHLLASPDGRRWRTIPSHQGGVEGGGGGGGDFWLGIDRKGIKIPKHVDVQNPHSFEIDDLKKLIQSATKDLEELDKQRRENFKKYEMEKEAQYRESLKNLTEEQKHESEKHHQEMLEKHKDHPKIHHPGSKPQLEQVWEHEDHMPKDEFNPRTFFAMHDINSDGHLDEKEVEAILIPEVKKMYDPKNEEDDPAEMEEEYHRMREHIFNETDKNKDGLISLEEFVKMTEQQEFERDEGWKGLDEEMVYSEDELQEFMRHRQEQMGMQYQPYYGDPQRMYYDVQNTQPQGVPPQIHYQVQHPQDIQQQQFHPGMPPQQPYHQPINPQQQQFQAGHPQQQQFQAGHPQQQQFQAGHPQQQQFQAGHPQQQQFQAGHPQQQQFQSGHPQQQQFQAGHPQQQQFQAGHPQQQQQFQAGHPQQQLHPSVLPQQQQPNYNQGMPPQPQFQPLVSSQQLSGAPLLEERPHQQVEAINNKASVSDQKKPNAAHSQGVAQLPPAAQQEEPSKT